MTVGVKRIVGLGAAFTFCGIFGVGYIDPSFFRRRFDPGKVPPFARRETPSREECLCQLKTFSSPEAPMDVLVVGGGSVGAGAALDAVTRGLSVGLVEMNDYASGTSSRSTKLIHGGVRYLEKAVFHLDRQQLRLVAEALRERLIMIHQAPHLCHDIPTIIPCYDAFDVIIYWCGMKLYDLIAIWQQGMLKHSGFLTPYNTLKKFPGLRHENKDGSLLCGSVQYYDGQMDDARMCLSVVLTAANYGAATVNYAKVEKMDVVQNKLGEPVVKSLVNDRESQTKFTVYSKAVINAGGPFSLQVQRLLTDKDVLRMAPSSGTHIVIEPKYCPKEGAMIVPSKDDRVVFGVSWLGGCVVGTTDRPCDVTEDVRPSEEDVRFLLGNLNEYVGKVPREAVLSAWTGIRPLVISADSQQGDTQNLVREHMILVDKDKLLLSVTGGKWTTYRQIAEDAVDRLCDTLLQGRVFCKPCVTDELRLVGAHDLASVPKDALCNVPADVHCHWKRNYGDRYNTLLNMVSRESKLLRRLHPQEPILEAEVVYAVRQEHCKRVKDFIAYRTRLAFLNVERSREIIQEVTRVMAEVNGWSKSKQSEELVNAYASLDSFSAQQ